MHGPKLWAKRHHTHLSSSTVGALVSLRSIARIEPNDHRQHPPRTTRAQIPSMTRGLPRANHGSSHHHTPTQAWDMPCPSGPRRAQTHPRARTPATAPRRAAYPALRSRTAQSAKACRYRPPIDRWHNTQAGTHIAQPATSLPLTFLTFSLYRGYPFRLSYLHLRVARCAIRAAPCVRRNRRPRRHRPSATPRCTPRPTGTQTTSARTAALCAPSTPPPRHCLCPPIETLGLLLLCCTESAHVQTLEDA